MQLDKQVRMRIYVGEDKRHGERPLYQAIVRFAREHHISGATVLRGTQGFGRSSRLHTTDVLFSEDLPAIIEIIDTDEKVRGLLTLLSDIGDIGLITLETVEVLHPAAHTGQL